MTRMLPDHAGRQDAGERPACGGEVPTQARVGRPHRTAAGTLLLGMCSTAIRLRKTQ